MNNFRFLHLADCHIGGWREPKLHNIGATSFTKSIDYAINNKVDFVLISGDLFNNAIPSIDNLKSTIEQLKKLKDNDINTYIIAGSHDFSISGKTIIDVLDKSGLAIDVVKADKKASIENNKLRLKFTIDPKTGVKITGMLGKKSMLEKKYYEELDYEYLQNETGFKIFMFHTALTEFLPKELGKMDSVTKKTLPNNFNYYAGGHVHYIFDKEEENKRIVFPGPLFPNNFSELENMNYGGFYDVEVKNGIINAKHIPIKLFKYNKITINCNNKTISEINEELFDKIENIDASNSIVTIRLFGIVKSGKISEIKFDDLYKKLYDNGCYIVLKSTTKLDYHTNKLVENIEFNKSDIETEILDKNIENKNNLKLTKNLIHILSNEKIDGEKNYDYESRIHSEIIDLLKL